MRFSGGGAAAVATAWAAVWVVCAGCARTPDRQAGLTAESVYRVAAAMGTRLEVEIDAEGRDTAIAASEAALGAIESAEKRLSTWDESSELSALNHARVGRRVALSPRLSKDLEAAFSWARELDRAFDPGMGALVSAWQLRRSPSKRETPGARTIRSARAASRPEHLTLEHGFATRRHAEYRIEEGAFGKGVGLDDALEAAQAMGARDVYLNLGGQILVSEGRRTEVLIGHPADRARPLFVLAVDRGSVSTSGTSEQGSHILDPRTGRPAPAFGSVTVWADTGIAADVISTGLFVMGPDRALKWARRHPEARVLILRGDSVEAIASCGLKNRLKALERSLKASFDCPQQGEESTNVSSGNS